MEKKISTNSNEIANGSVNEIGKNNNNINISSNSNNNNNPIEIGMSGSNLNNPSENNELKRLNSKVKNTFFNNSMSLKNNNNSFKKCKSEKDKKLSTLFWMRIALGIIAGAATTFLLEDIEGEERRWTSIGFMIMVFFASIIWVFS